MPCCCKVPVPTVTVSSIDATTTLVTLTVSGFTGALGSCGLFNLCIPQCIENQYAGATVSLTDGSSTWPLLDRSGNNLRVTQLLCRRCKKLWHCRLGNDPAHITVCDRVPITCNSTNTTTPAASTTESA